jgi:hypothetical protein
MPIKVELKSFYVEGNKLHLTLEFPDEVQVDSNIQAEASPIKVDRQQILRCNNVSQVLYLLKASPDKCLAVKSFQVSENEVGRRLTPRKIADLLFPKKQTAVEVIEKSQASIEEYRGYQEVLRYYNLFADAGVNESNYTRIVNPEIVTKYTSLSLFCSRGSEDQIQAELNTLNGI